MWLWERELLSFLLLYSMVEPPVGGERKLPLLVAEDGAVKAEYHFAKVHFVAEEEE